MFQWGKYYQATAVTTTFPKAFASACYNITAQSHGTSSNNMSIYRFPHDKTLTGFSSTKNGDFKFYVYYLAIGK